MGLPLTEHARLIMSERLTDGYRLLDARRFTGAAYLGGYVGELALEVAFFSLPGGQQWVAEDWKRAFAYAKGRAAELEVEEKPEGFHNLYFWSELIVKAVRSDQALKHKHGTRASLYRFVETAKKIGDLWEPELRYTHRDIGLERSSGTLTLARNLHRDLSHFNF